MKLFLFLAFAIAIFARDQLAREDRLSDVMQELINEILSHSNVNEEMELNREPKCGLSPSEICEKHIDWAFGNGQNDARAAKWYPSLLAISGKLKGQATRNDVHHTFYCDHKALPACDSISPACDANSKSLPCPEKVGVLNGNEKKCISQPCRWSGDTCFGVGCPNHTGAKCGMPHTCGYCTFFDIRTGEKLAKPRFTSSVCPRTRSGVFGFGGRRQLAREDRLSDVMEKLIEERL